MLMAVDLLNKKTDQNLAEISFSTNVFVEVTATNLKDHQILTYLRLHHDVFGDQGHDFAERIDLQNHTQVSSVELDSLLESKKEELHLIKDGSKVGYVNLDAFKQITNDILVHLNSDTARATGEIKAQDILNNQQDEIKAVFANITAINFGLNYIADYNEKTVSYKLNPFKIRKFLGESLLIEKGDFQLSEFRTCYRNALEIGIPASLAE